MLSREYISQYRKNLIIALPIVASQVGHILVGFVDSFMVGRNLGGVSLAAATVAFSVYIPVMMLGIGISYGVSPMIAKSDGEKNTEEISILFKHSIFLNLAIGILIAGLLISLSFLLRSMNQPFVVVEKAIPFFEILALSTIPLMIFQSFRQFAEGLSVTFPSMIISIAGNVVNICLIYLLVIGEFGMPRAGLNGVGYATLSARVFMALCMFIFVLYYPKFRIYWKVFSTISYSVKEFLKLLKMCLPVGVQLALESGAFGFAAIMIGWIGSDELAAHHLALNMAAITYMAASGIASASTVRVGNELGKHDYKAIRLAGFSAFHIVLLLMGMSALGFVLFRHSLPQFFISEANIQHIAVSLLLISALFQLSDGVQVVGLGALRGLGDVRIPTAIALFAYWFIGLPVGYFMAFYLGFKAEGIWYGLLIGLTVAAIFLFVRFDMKSKKLIRTNLGNVNN